MKKQFILAAVILFTLAASAQNARLFISPGLSLAKSDLEGVPSTTEIKYKPGFDGGVGLDYSLSPKFSLQLEANYSMQGLKAEGSGSEAILSVNYITVPLLAKIKPAGGLSIILGPQVGFLLNGEVEEGGSTSDIKDIMKSTDFYGVFGAEYQLPMGVFFGARYNLGLTNVLEEPGEMKNRYISIRVGYSFPLGSK